MPPFQNEIIASDFDLKRIGKHEFGMKDCTPWELLLLQLREPNTF